MHKKLTGGFGKLLYEPPEGLISLGRSTGTQRQGIVLPLSPLGAGSLGSIQPSN